MTLIDEEKKGSRKALWLTENFDKVLSVILIGNNLVNIAISTLGLRLFLGLFESDATWIDIVNTLVITLIVLIFGEILPKSHGKASPEKNALKLSGPLYVVVKILTPIAYPFYKMNRIALDKLDSDSESISSDDLENIIDSMEDSGEIEKDEADMLQKVLDLSTIDVKNIMTPRVDTIVLDIDAPLDEVRKCFFDNQYSRVPVYEGTIDHIVGILYEKEFFKAIIQKPNLKTIKTLLQKPLFVVGSMTADNLLSLLKQRNVHLAIVLDEYGGFDGVVTMEDVLEELVGEIFDEHDEVPFTITKVDEDNYLVSGDLEVENLFDYFSFEEPLENIDSTTIGGWVQDKLERLPMIDDEVSFRIISKVLYSELDEEEGIEYAILTFKIKDIENNRINTLELNVKIEEDSDEQN